MLFHVSENAGIERFEPRPSPHAPEPVVWAVTGDRLCNYLLPRDCPRVTFYAGTQPTEPESGIARLLGANSKVVAVEDSWLGRISATRLYVYRLPETSFTLIDANAGYMVSATAVAPAGFDIVDDIRAAIAANGAKLLAVPSLWPLHDAVAASTQHFSMIRMRNAMPRDTALP